MALRTDWQRVMTPADLDLLPAPVPLPAARVRTAVTVLVLLALDALSVSAAFGFAYLVRFKSEWSFFYEHTESPVQFYSTLVFLLVPMVLVIFAFYQLYSTRHVFDGASEYARIVSAATLSMLLVVLLSFFFDGDLIISRGWIVISWIALILCVGGSRFLLRRVVYALRRRGYAGQRVAIVASGSDRRDLAERLAEVPDSGLHVVAVLEPEDLLATSSDSDDRERLRGLATQYGIDQIIVSSASVPQTTLEHIVREMATASTELQLIPGMYDIQTTGVRAREIRGIPLVTLNKVRITGFDFFLKAVLDYAAGIIALLVLLPVLLVMALAIKLTSPGPVLHKRRVVAGTGAQIQRAQIPHDVYQWG